ncbi:MAG TPA: type II toxin-antitoxin system Phd/YefM family antitoxin [Roseiarcus sp.]|nr:type II toxin-antitoxin system Phd/YefM family antitoxin [Roseiarcus sp.]
MTKPVVVTRNGRDRTVLISAEEYRRLKRRDRHVFGIGDFPTKPSKPSGAPEWACAITISTSL